MQQRLKQTKVCHAFLYFVWKEMAHKPLKVAATISLFSSVYVIGATCLGKCFSFVVITKRHYFSWKFIVTLRFFKHHFATFFEASVLKEVRIFMRYVHINNMRLIPNYQNKADYFRTFLKASDFSLRIKFSCKWHSSL